MAAYQITGGRKLSGEIQLQGAKNSALPILAATVLVPGKTILHHCPDLLDTQNALKILRHLGCRAKMELGTVEVDASQISRNEIPVKLMNTMRSSILFAGALLARTGGCQVSCPGGCQIGKRPIDLHLQAFSALGYEVDCREDGIISIKTGIPCGTIIPFRFPSVGATENAMLVSSGMTERTIVIDAAREPEIVDLQGFLRQAGFDVAGAGSSAIVQNGGKVKKEVEYTIMPDRICGETYLAAVAGTGGEIRLLNAESKNNRSMLQILARAGCEIQAGEHEVVLRSSGKLQNIGMVRTGPYPAFSTDSGALLTAALLRAEGTTILAETIFENRFRHIEELKKLGADLKIFGKLCRIRGCSALKSATMCAQDLRGGAALVIGALQAQGNSLVTGTEYIGRGYEGFCSCLQQLGACIEETGA